MHSIEKIKNHDLGLLVLRLAIGLIFLAHGWDKFMHMAGTLAFFGKLGMPAFMAYLVAAIEFLGGIALVVGTWTTTAGFLLAIIGLSAIFLVKLPKGLLGGYELELAVAAGALAVALLGAGKYRILKK